MKTLLKPLLITLGIAFLVPTIAQAQASPDEKIGSCGKMESPGHRGHPEAGIMPSLPIRPSCTESN